MVLNASRRGGEQASARFERSRRIKKSPKWRFFDRIRIKEAIEEYKKIYKKVEGKEISDEEARERGTRPINLFRAIYGVNNKKKD